MNSEEFKNVLNDQINRILEVLAKKGDEYATHDQLHNFKICATLEGCNPKQALAGLMAKHTVSIYDMIGTGNDFSIDAWDEKITDHINYLILLRALIVEEENERLKRNLPV